MPNTSEYYKFEPLNSSFRDPAGAVFEINRHLYRLINSDYKDDYKALINSGLYDHLVKLNFLVSHVEVEDLKLNNINFYKIIKPKKIDFISHPYEWSFSQLKDAALLTLDIQLQALKHDLILKDASAYNIQFSCGKPILIDTLSFERYVEGMPWVAYKQFCQHFLAPLALMSNADINLAQLLRIHIDGIPLGLTSRLLPLSSWFKWGLLGHLHMHAKAQSSMADTRTKRLSSNTLSRNALIGLIESLRSTVKKLIWNPIGTEWGDYYENTNYSHEALDQKRVLIDEYLSAIHPSVVWDLGSNTGVFSRISSKRNISTISFDIDPAAVEKNYLKVKCSNEKFLLPLILDLTNPSPFIGWSNSERADLISRGPADCAIALALIHHLAISNNVPLSSIAKFLAKICSNLIIEFIPKSDSQVKRLLITKRDIFGNYDQANFEKAFSEHFSIERKSKIAGSERTLYLMQRI